MTATARALSRRRLLASAAALALAPRALAAAEPNLLPRLGESRAPTVADAFWQGGPVPLETYWRRMGDLTGLIPFKRVAPLDAEHRGDPLFGVCNALVGDDALAPLMRGVGATIDRVELRWDVVGDGRWEGYDRLFDAAERWGLQVLPVLIGGDPMRDPRGWERFVAAAAARYGRRVAAWEVWNEPNIGEFWPGTLAAYADLLRRSYGPLHETAPVLPGGMVQDDGSWLRGLLRAGAPFDLVAWHVYGEADEVTRLARLTRQLTDRPIWITEASAPLLPLYALAKAERVERVLVYRAADVGDHLWGMLHEDLRLKPSFLTYRTAAGWLGGRAFVRQHSPTHVELDGAHVVWGPPPALPAGEKLLVYPSGASRTVRGDASGEPRIVVSGI